MTFALLALLGAVLTMDGVTVGQFMVSRPLVAAGLAGLILGDPGQALLVGAILEAFLLVAVPSGGGRFPEPGPAAVVGAAGAVWIPGPGGLALGIAAALLLGWVGAVTQAGQRHLAERWVPDPERGRVTPSVVVRAHLGSIAVDGARGLVLTAVGLAAVAAAGAVGVDHWPLPDGETRGLLLLGAFVSLGIMGRTLLSGGRWVLLLTGLVAGFVAGWGLPW